MKKLVVLIVVIALLLGGYYYLQTQPDPSIKSMPIVTAIIKDQKFSLYAPNTDEGLRRGLSVLDHLEPDQGMIFRGLPVGVQTFWMKDMKFNIDILWVNKENQVIHIVYEASKNNHSTLYKNPADNPSSYVIELAAGTAEKYGIAPGDMVTIR